MDISVKKIDLKTKSKFDSENFVIGEFSNSKSAQFKSLDKELSGLLTEAVEAENFKFDLGEVFTINLRKSEAEAAGLDSLRKILLVGLGDRSNFNKDLLKNERKAIAAAIRAAKIQKIKTLSFAVIKNPESVVEIAELVSYEFDKYKTKKDEDYSGLESLEICADSTAAAIKKSISEAQIIAESVNFARDLVWEPACTVTPTYLADVAKTIKGKGIKVKVLDKAQCEKLGMGAYLAVAQGSDQPPKFIEITYTAATYNEKRHKHLALVGKGVTFDSGGLSLKPPKSMEMMKEDMAGSAAVLGTMRAVSILQPKNIKITMIVAATENMPSGKAYRPGDVITAMNGKTIEVNNTDAEGRLTLADAVAYVSKYKPDAIIDMATLTGACMVALGNHCAGLMTNDQKLLDSVKKFADEKGELMWQLPLFDEYRVRLKSEIADLKNAGSGGQAGAQNGGLFVQEFVGDDDDGKQLPWLHIDIAGPCWFDEPNEWSPKGASGIPVRTLLSYIQSLS